MQKDATDQLEVHNSRWSIRRTEVSVSVFPAELRDELQIIGMEKSIGELESLMEYLVTNNELAFTLTLDPDFQAYLHNRVYQFTQCSAVWRVFSKNQIHSIFENVRNRLLVFILELMSKYPNFDVKALPQRSQITKESLEGLFLNVIMGNNQNIVNPNNLVTEGGNMPVFDQRHQKVNYQYNAAGNINFDSVQNVATFVGELEKIRQELQKAGEAGVINEEQLTDADYQISKAINQSKSEQPDSSKIIGYLNGTASVIKTVGALAGLIPALTKAIEIAQQIF